MNCEAEAALALQKRIEKNRDKFFTFLNYDGVPCNNNNAEHAVRAFTRLPNAINTSTPKGTREFATLPVFRRRYATVGWSSWNSCDQAEWRLVADLGIEPLRFNSQN